MNPVRWLRQLPDNVRGILLITSVMLASVIQILDTTIANVALPHMQGSMSATQDQISWVLTSYIIASAISMPMTGWITGRFGRKRLLICAVTGFTGASVLCGMAQSLPEMIAFRMLQGLFGASLVPISQSVLLDTFPIEKHAKAMSIWGLGAMVAPILGPTIGGWLTEYYNWRWVFYINVPFGILSLIGVIALVEESPLNFHRRFDIFGFVLLSTCIGALQMMLDRGQSHYWFASKEIITEFVISLLALYMFIVHIFTYDHPFIELRLFRDRNFPLGLVFIFVVGIILLATLALLPPFLQSLMGYSVFDAGLILAPRGGGTMIAMMVASQLKGRFDPRPVILLGLCCTAASLWFMTKFTLDVSTSVLAWTGVLQGMGLGFIFVSLSTIAFATLPQALRTEAASIFNLVRNIGSSIGISLVVSQLADNIQREHAALADHITPFNALLNDPMVAQFWNTETVQGLAALNGVVTLQAAQMAYIDDFRLIMVMAFLTMPLVLLLKPEAPALDPGGASSPTPAHQAMD
jgi:DHA2 family multidrug resistance protein